MITFPLWDIAQERYVSVKGPVSRVFRHKEVPFVEVSYAEYAGDTGLVVSKEFFSNQPTFEELVGAVSLSLEVEVLEKQMGIIPEGIASSDPVEINLSHIPFHEVELSNI